MSDSTRTTQDNIYNILSDLWMGYREEDAFEEFVSYNDLGLPLSYAVSNQIVKPTETTNQIVNETWELLLEVLSLDDTGFEDLEAMLDLAE